MRKERAREFNVATRSQDGIEAACFTVGAFKIALKRRHLEFHGFGYEGTGMLLAANPIYFWEHLSLYGNVYVALLRIPTRLSISNGENYQ